MLASFGPGKAFNNAEIIVENTQVFDESNTYDDALAAHKLEHSYLGYLGKGIEPIIQPLRFDWKIGIGIIASFAAREVFVGTMASIYSVGSKKKMVKLFLKNYDKLKIIPQENLPILLQLHCPYLYFMLSLCNV